MPTIYGNLHDTLAALQNTNPFRQLLTVEASVKLKIFHYILFLTNKIKMIKEQPSYFERPSPNAKAVVTCMQSY